MTRSWMIVVGSIFSLFSAIMGINAISGATDLLATAYRATHIQVSMATTLYLTAQIFAIPMTSFFLHKIPARKLAVYASLFFIFAAILCVISTSLNSFLFSRICQGLASGLLVSCPTILIKTHLTGKQQTRAIMLTAISSTMSPIAGPILVGFTDSQSTDLIFFAMIIISSIGLFLLASAKDVNETVESKPVATNMLSLFSFSVFIIGISLLVYTLQTGAERGWMINPEVRMYLYLSGFCIILSVLHQWHSHKSLLPFSIMLEKDVRGVLAIGLTMGAAMYGLMFLIPYYLIKTMGASPVEIMQTSLYWVLPQFIMLPLVLWLRNRLSSSLLIALGCIIIGTSLFVMSLHFLQISSQQLIVGQILRGIGIPISSLCISVMLVHTIPKVIISETTVMYSLFRSLGGVTSIVFMVTFIDFRLRQHEHSIINVNCDECMKDTAALAQKALQVTFMELFFLFGLFFLISGLAFFIFRLREAKL